MTDQQTIDRVCIGLAYWAIDRRDHARFVGEDAALLPGIMTYPLLLDLLGIPEPIPDWAEHALAGHNGTPEELVAALRELATEVTGG